METRKLQRILFVQRILITFKARRVDRQWIDYIAFWQFPGSGNVSQRLRINLNFAPMAWSVDLPEDLHGKLYKQRGALVGRAF
ncbi:Uncharacterised protein [Escherichia coli]|uniref:Uncharacterized protein n=1 Tax=Escherichia coli TaxID=562 RepID=A0A376KXA1_ECOLX|nr:Uncharacterised protein [Escherichia coli]